MLLLLLALQCPDGQPAPCERRDPDALAISPLVYQGPPATAWLAGTATALVAHALDGLAGWRVVPASLAQRAATRITGTVITIGPQMRVRLELRDAVSGRVLRTAEHRSSSADPAPAVDSAAAGLARHRLAARGPLSLQRSVSEYGSTSTRAWRAYLAAEAALRQGRVGEALDSLAAAVDADRSFGPAWYRAYLTLTAWPGAPAATTLLQNPAAVLDGAMRNAARLPPRHRDILNTVSLRQRDSEAAAQAARALVERYPDDPDALYVAGEVAYHWELGPSARQRALRLFASALAADSIQPESYQHLAELLADRGDTAAAFHILERGIARFPAFHALRPLALAMTVALRGHAPIFADSFAQPRRWQRMIFRAARYEVPRVVSREPARAAMISEALLLAGELPELPADQRAWTRTELALLALARGSPSAAAEHLAQARRYQPDFPGIARITLLGGILYPAWRAEARRVVAAALRPDSADPALLWAQGTLAFADSDTAALRRAAEGLRAGHTTFLRATATGMDGWLALLRGDSAAARELLRRALRAHSDGFDLRTPERPMALTLAALDLAAGDTTGASETMDHLHLARDGLAFAAPAEELRARIALARGDSTEARRALRSFIALWNGADPELQPRVAAAHVLLASRP